MVEIVWDSWFRVVVELSVLWKKCLRDVLSCVSVVLVLVCVWKWSCVGDLGDSGSLGDGIILGWEE